MGSTELSYRAYTDSHTLYLVENYIAATICCAPCHTESYIAQHSKLQILLSLNTLWTGDADLRLYITTVKDG